MRFMKCGKKDYIIYFDIIYRFIFYESNLEGMFSKKYTLYMVMILQD